MANNLASPQPATTFERHNKLPEPRKMRIMNSQPHMNLRERLRRTLVLPILLTLTFSKPGEAWNDKTHMTIAYIAYRNLNRHAKERVDEVLVLHPLYKQWTKDAKVGRAGLYAFMHAATWPDCIQNSAKCDGYVADGTDDGMTPPVSQEAWQNAGYSDKFMHKYWHFIQQPYAEDRVTREVQKPNVETQLQLLTETLNSNAGDALKSYDLAWVENLVGELHQPLNCISRFSSQHPTGDKNGREVKLCKAPCDNNLHDYWDNLLGTGDDFTSGMKEGKALAHVQNTTWWFDSLDIRKWVNDSMEVARNIVYAPTIVAADSAGDPTEPNETYHKAAVHAATNQVILAGHRLAALLNANLK